MQKNRETLSPSQKKRAIKKSILVIDDSPDMLELRKTILEMDGIEVFSAASGTDALRILKEIKVDLVLLDFSLGDMNGPEFLKRLEAEQPQTLKEVPVVFLTGMDKNEVPPTKATGLISKSAGMEQFLKSVHSYFRK